MKIQDVSKVRGPLQQVQDQLFGRNGEEFLAKLNLWLKQVEQRILVTDIDRALTNEQALEAVGRILWCKNQVELDSAPRFSGDQVELDFVEFDHPPSIAEVNAIYVDGWVADLVAVAKYMQVKPEAADNHSIAIQWGVRNDGTSAYVIWDQEDHNRGWVLIAVIPSGVAVVSLHVYARYDFLHGLALVPQRSGE